MRSPSQSPKRPLQWQVEARNKPITSIKKRAFLVHVEPTRSCFGLQYLTRTRFAVGSGAESGLGHGPCPTRWIEVSVHWDPSLTFQLGSLVGVGGYVLSNGGEPGVSSLGEERSGAV